MVDLPTLGLSIVFNGCNLQLSPNCGPSSRRRGYNFFSSGDTFEVVVKAWHAWGRDCVDRFKGMFAFVIHERDSDRVIMARDRFGIKPLLPGRDTSIRSAFASTLPACSRPATSTPASTATRCTTTCRSTPWCRRAHHHQGRAQAAAGDRSASGSQWRAQGHVTGTRPTGAIPNIRACRSRLARSVAGIARAGRSKAGWSPRAGRRAFVGRCRFLRIHSGLLGRNRASRG